MQGGRFVDLTHTFAPGIPHWKGAPNQRVERLYNHERDGFQIDEYCHVGQWGTHIDPPSHFHAGKRTLDRIPPVRDIGTMIDLIRHTGADVQVDGGRVTVHAATIDKPEAPYEVVKTMRASSLVLGPLVARCGRARVSLPGGCAIGARPINLHVGALEQLGAEVRQEHGYIEAVAPQGLQGATVEFDRITVTGTDLMPRLRPSSSMRSTDSPPSGREAPTFTSSSTFR